MEAPAPSTSTTATQVTSTSRYHDARFGGLHESTGMGVASNLESRVISQVSLSPLRQGKDTTVASDPTPTPSFALCLPRKRTASEIEDIKKEYLSLLQVKDLAEMVYGLEKERARWRAEGGRKGKEKEVDVYPTNLEDRWSELKSRKTVPLNNSPKEIRHHSGSRASIELHLSEVPSEPGEPPTPHISDRPLSPTGPEIQQEQTGLSVSMQTLSHPQSQAPHPMFSAHPPLPPHPTHLPFIYPPVYVAPQPLPSPPGSVSNHEGQSVSMPGGRTNSGRTAAGVGGNGMPSYEEMLVMAISDLREAEGSAPKNLFDWMLARFPLASNFRPSAHQALQKAYKRGRLERLGAKYRLNPNWEGGSTSRRTTRRPQMANAGMGIPGRLPGFPWAMIPAPPPADNHQGGPGTIMSHPFNQSHQATSMSVPSQVSGSEVGSLEFLSTVAAGDNASPSAAALLQAIAGINGMMEGDVEEGDDGKTESGDDDDEDGAGDQNALQASLNSLAEQLKMAAARVTT